MRKSEFGVGTAAIIDCEDQQDICMSATHFEKHVLRVSDRSQSLGVISREANWRSILAKSRDLWRDFREPLFANETAKKEPFKKRFKDEIIITQLPIIHSAMMRPRIVIWRSGC